MGAEDTAHPTVPGRAVPRRFVDAAHHEWPVHEPSTGDVARARVPRSLRFSSETAIRRAGHYPATWRVLSDHACEALSWGT